MRNNILNLRLISIVLCLLFLQGGLAQDYYHAPQTLDEAINTPIVKDNKSHKIIAEYQTRQARIMSEDRNIKILMTRDQEVIIVTIPADLLFDPNATELNREAANVLQHYTAFLRTPDYYRMAIAMYHDNTGSEQFCKNLTDKRLQSIYDWFAINSSVKYLSKFSFGQSDPILPNNSIQNRRQNRRLEIYLIPGTTMIDQAKRNILR